MAVAPLWQRGRKEKSKEALRVELVSGVPPNTQDTGELEDPLEKV